MQVFKAYFKVMRLIKTSLLLHLGIFMVLAMVFSEKAPQSNQEMFEPNKTAFAIIDYDLDNPLAQGLEKHLEQVGRRVLLPDDKEALQDALFYRRVQYIAIIPEGFSHEFMNGNEPKVAKVIVPNSTNSYYMDMNIDAFLNTARFHHMAGGYPQEELVTRTMADLSTNTKVVMKQFGTSREREPGYYFFFRYCAHALLAIVVHGISSNTIVFNREDLYMRNRCAPLRQRKISLQLLAGHGIFAFACWIALMMQAIFLYGEDLFGSGLTHFYFLNTLAFASVCVSIGFLAGDLIKNHNAQAGITQVIALGLNFLGGVFVPQSLMSPSVLAVARFLPTFWFVRANELITGLGAISRESLLPIYGNILIQAGFAVAISAVALLLRKERRVAHFA